MLKSASQMRFEQESENLEKQLDIFSQRLSKVNSFEKINIHLDTFSQFNTKIKSINSLYNKIDSQMKMKKNYNQYDLKQKLRKYAIIKQKILGKYESIGREIQSMKRKYLTDKRKSRESGSGNKDIQMKNMNKVNELMSRYHGMNNDLQQTEQITSAWIPELHNQGQKIKEMREDLKETEAELGMVDQLMRIIKNRNLFSKLALLIMIVLMAIADLWLFVYKIMR